MQATRNNPSAIPNIPSPAQCLQEKARLQEDDQAFYSATRADEKAVTRQSEARCDIAIAREGARRIAANCVRYCQRGRSGAMRGSRGTAPPPCRICDPRRNAHGIGGSSLTMRRT